MYVCILSYTLKIRSSNSCVPILVCFCFAQLKIKVGQGYVLRVFIMHCLMYLSRKKKGGTYKKISIFINHGSTQPSIFISSSSSNNSSMLISGASSSSSISLSIPSSKLTFFSDLYKLMFCLNSSSSSKSCKNIS